MSEPKYEQLSPSERQQLLKEEELECATLLNERRLRGTNIGWILSVVFALTTLLLAVRLYALPSDRYQHTGDINGIAPRFSQRIIEFAPEDRATASIGHPEKYKETEDFWSSITPAGIGRLSIPWYTAERYPNLHPPTQQLDFSLFDTSMAHQLHCLHSIMDAYNQLKDGSSPHHDGGSGHQHHDHSWHLGHCFDYIRQGIMCCADTAIEGKAEHFPNGIQGSDGWNTKHICKDYDEVKSWMIGMEVPANATD